MRTPLWELDVLIGEIDFIEGVELQQAVTAASSPHMKREHRDALMRNLGHVVRPRGPAPANAFTAEIFNDFDAAAAFFTSLGIEVRRVNAS